MNYFRCIQRVIFLFMKISMTQFILASSVISLAGAAEIKGQEVLDRKISLHVADTKVSDVLKEIERQADVTFSYRFAIIRNSENVTLDFENQALRMVLERMLGNDVTFYVRENEIALLPRPRESIPPAPTPDKSTVSYEITVSGTVTDEKNEPVPGVNVLEKGTTNGITTDALGQFALAVTNEGSVLVFSFIGYTTQEVAVGSQTQMNIALQPDVKALDEVVVVGYGTQKKANLTGATSSVSFQTLENRPIGNTATLLQGQLPGVTVGAFNAQPGNDNPEIRIRGVGTFNAGQNPLVIVDGVESTFSQIPTSDIESVSVLKDAASAAIYGVRAANGVILVTTKRGSAKKPTISVKQNYALQEAAVLPDMVDSWDFANIINLSREANSQAPLYTPEMIQTMRDGSDPDRFANTDWVKESFRMAPMNTTYLSVNGGTETTKYLVSGEYFDQKGIAYGTDTKRYSFRSNIDTKATEWLDIGLNLSGHYRKINETLNSANESGGNSSIFYQMRRTSNPLVPLRYRNGQWGSINGLFDQTSQRYPNSAYMAQRGEYFTNRYFLQGIVFAEMELLKNLKYRVNFGAIYNSANQTRFTPTEKLYDPDGDVIFENTQNQLENNNATDHKFIVENVVTYDLGIQNHKFNFLLGQASQYYRYDYMSASVKGLPNDQIHELSAGVIEKDVAGNANEVSLQSFFGRVNYNFGERYLFEANVRYDGSSKMPPANKYGMFPSFSAGWILSNENLLKDTPLLSFLKLRASWGQLGNQEIGNYAYVQNIDLGQDYIFGETLTPGAALTDLANDKLKWETTTVTNIGLDFNFFDDRLQVVADWFDKTSSDILVTIPIPGTLGNVGAPYQNIAEVQNRGVELDVKFNNNFRSLNYFAGFNLSSVRNEIIDIAGLTSWLSNGSRHINLTGYPIQSYYGLIAEGYFQNEDEIATAPAQFSALKPGDVKFKDISGPDGVPDGKVDEAYDRTIIGNPFPKLTYAFNFGGNIKGFDLYCLFQGVSGVDRYFWYNNEEAGNFTTAALDYWTPDNRDAAYARFGNQPNNNKNSTLWIGDASYLRLKNIELGYTLPAALVRKIGIQSCRFYTSATNLLTFTDVVDFDPEKIQEDERNRVYPQSKVYSLGLNLTF